MNTLEGAKEARDFVELVTGRRVSLSVVERWIRANDNPLPSRLVAGRRVFRTEEVTAWLDARWPGSVRAVRFAAVRA